MRKFVLISVMLAACGSDQKSDTKEPETKAAAVTEPTPSPEPANIVPPELECDGFPAEVKPLTDEERQIRTVLDTIKVGDELTAVLPEAREILFGDQVEVKDDVWILGCKEATQYKYDTFFGTGDRKFQYLFQLCDGKFVGKKFCEA